MAGKNDDMPRRPVYSSKVGDLLVVMPPGLCDWVVAEVISLGPFRLKATERGLLSDLEGAACVIHESATAAVQGFDRDRALVASDFARDGHPLLSGLDRLGMGGEELFQVTFL